MRKGCSILFGIMLIFAIPSLLAAQRHANASAAITATVLPAVGVEVEERISTSLEKEKSQSDFIIKVNDIGKYSLQIFENTNKNAAVTKVLEAKSTYRIQEREVCPKTTIQIAVLSS